MFVRSDQCGPSNLRDLAERQVLRIEALIGAARAARPAAAEGLLFASRSGKALVNAAFDLFECDELYRLGEDVGHELSRGRD